MVTKHLYKTDSVTIARGTIQATYREAITRSPTAGGSTISVTPPKIKEHPKITVAGDIIRTT